jgi:FtsZ-interacting cell division protein YlmF
MEKSGLKRFFDKITFREPEPVYGDEGGAAREMNYDYQNDYTSEPTESDKIMRFPDRLPKSKLKFYKLKGHDWLEVVKKSTLDFKDGCAVMINTEEANKDAITRMLDFMGGVAYSHNGRLVRQGTTTHAVIPENCEASGDDIGGDIYDSISGFSNSSFE